MRARTIGCCLAAGVLAGVVTVHGAAARPTPQRLNAATVTSVSAPIAANATAVLANIAMTDALGPGYINADRCSAIVPGPQPRASGNYDLGSTVANLSVVRVDPGGTFCAVNQSPVNLVVDSQGWFAPVGGTGGTFFVGSQPRRVLDTRERGAQPGIGWITPVQTGAAPGSAAVLANISMVDATRAGYVTADRCSALVAGPQLKSNGNHGVGSAVSNLSVVPIDPDGRFCIFNLVPVHLVVDVQGEFAPTSGSGVPFFATEPARLLDTRATQLPPPPAGVLTRVETGLGSSVSAALVNIAMVGALAPGYVTAGRCSTMTSGPQAQANGNHAIGGAVSNLSVVPLDPDGGFCVYNQSPVHLVVDLQGGFGPGGNQLFFPMEAVRVLDTRPPGGEPPPTASTVPPATGSPTTSAPLPPIAPGSLRTSCTSVVHIGDSTSVGMVSASYIPEPEGRLDAQYRRVGVADPRMEISGARSIVETLRGQLNARDAAAKVKATGYRGCWVFALGTTDTANLALAPGGVSRRERIDRMMTVAAGDPVLWVNTRTIRSQGEWGNPWMQLWNSELQAALSRWPNLEIYDWASAARTSWFSSDGVHYTSDGYRWRAILIANAIAEHHPG